MNTVHVIQADDPPRAISVQNPMSLNDLMINQPRRLSTSAVPRGQFQQSAPRRPIQRSNVQLPPPTANFMGGGTRMSVERNMAPPMRSNHRSGQSADVEEVDPEEMGYDLILNEQKMKKPEVHESREHRVDDMDDDIPVDDNRATDDFVDPRERRNFEHDDYNHRPNLPPPSPHRPGSTPSRLNVNAMSPPPQFHRQQPSGGGAAQFGFYPKDTFDGPPRMNYEEEMEKKQKYLEGLDKFRRRGMKIPQYDMNSPFEDVESEYNRNKRTIDVEASIQFSRKMLMACVTGLEYLNTRYDPLGLKLDGWSESVIEDIHNYDDVFERLYDKYHTSVQMAPEFELLLMVAGSAFMYHLTNSMFKSAMPGMGNPEMMRNVRRGVMGAMRGAFNGGAEGGGVGGMMSGMFGGGAGGAGGARSGPPRSPPPPQNPRGSRNQPPPQRREMNGPSGNMDDLLNNLMDREPGEVSERILDDIDDILNNPSDEERDVAPSRTVRVSATTGPGGSAALRGNQRPVDI